MLSKNEVILQMFAKNNNTVYILLAQCDASISSLKLSKVDYINWNLLRLEKLSGGLYILQYFLVCLFFIYSKLVENIFDSRSYCVL